MKKEKTQREKLWEALAKYGITTEAELNREIKKMQPLNIGCMVSPVDANSLQGQS